MATTFESRLERAVSGLQPDAAKQTRQDIELLRDAGGTSLKRLLTIVQDRRIPADLRMKAVSLVRSLRTRTAVPTLLNVLEDTGDDPGVRRESAWALGDIGARQAVLDLIRVLEEDPDPELRNTATYALGQIGAREAVAPLIRALQNSRDHPDVRSGAAEALGDLALRGEPSTVEAVPSLLGALHDADAWIRHDSAVALGYLRESRAIGPLVELLQKDPSLEVREAAAIGLSWIRSKEAVGPLILALENQREHEDVRHAAAHALYHIRSKDSVPALIVALSDPSPEVRYWSTAALGRLRSVEALPTLERLAATDVSILPGWGPVKDQTLDAIQRIRSKRVADRAP